MDELNKAECEAIIRFFLSDSTTKDTDSTSAFLRYYEEQTLRWRLPHPFYQHNPLLTSDEQIRTLIEVLRDNPDLTRREYEMQAWPWIYPSKKEDLEVIDAVGVIVSLGFMLHCSAKEHYAKGHHIGNWSPCQWDRDSQQSFKEFLNDSLPRRNDTGMTPQDHFMDVSAWKLMKRCKIKIRPTDYLDEHLLYVRKPHVHTLRVFRHSAWLQAQLGQPRRSDSQNELDVITVNTVNMCQLPEQFLFEILESSHRILFSYKHEEDGKSQDVFDQLVRDQGFERSIPAQTYMNLIPRLGVRYVYLEDRLQTLYDVLHKPPPTNRLMVWAETVATDRFALMIAISALLFSILLGLLSVLVGVVQIVLTYQAWKYPVCT